MARRADFKLAPSPYISRQKFENKLVKGELRGLLPDSCIQDSKIGG
jgi:hypothetical protein